MTKTTLPLRTHDERMQFFDAYFSAVGAEVTYHSDYYREYRLPRDVDKELSDRPFYWLWAEKMNQDVPPTTLRLAFHPDVLSRENERIHELAWAEAEKRNLSDIERMYFRPPTAELITLGSFRLEKLYTSVDQRGAFACVAPAKRQSHARFVPWLMANAQISYRCDAVEQEIISVGICLANGEIVEHFYDMVKKIEMTAISPQEMLTGGKLTPETGLEKVRAYIDTVLRRRPTEWAKDATVRLDQEIRQIKTYYQSILPDVPDDEKVLVEAEQLRKVQELTERTQPRVEVDIRQIALVALVDRT